MNKKRCLIFAGGSLPFAALCFQACSNLLILDPKGPIGEAERSVILVAIALMLLVVIPVFIMAFWFSWRYRVSNTEAVYTPKWHSSRAIHLAVWSFPIAIVTALAVLGWLQTHRVNPYKPLLPSVNPVRIQAVSMDWKWLFIYPDHHIATVNQIVFPVKVPLSFRLTSDSVMCSFFIPQLGSQIYAMPGKQTRLHLLASEPGVFRGQNQQFSGRGFATMHFEAKAVSRDDFEAWVRKASRSPFKLDWARFEELRKPSVRHPVTLFSWVEPELFMDIIRQYRPGTSSRATYEGPGIEPEKGGVSEAH